MVQEGGKSKIKVSDEIPLPGFQMAIFSLYPYMEEAHKHFVYSHESFLRVCVPQTLKLGPHGSIFPLTLA